MGVAQSHFFPLHHQCHCIKHLAHIMGYLSLKVFYDFIMITIAESNKGTCITSIPMSPRCI